MSALDRKLGRDLLSAIGRLMAITSIITVGVACYIEMSSCYTNLMQAKERYYAACRMADFSIELKKAPVVELAAIAQLPEVVEVRPRIQFFATADLPRVAELLNALVLSLPDEREAVINDVVLQRGSYFTEQRRNEVIVNDAFARQHGLRPGQWIHLILNNRRQELFIVGTAISSEFVYLLGPGAITPDPEHFGVFYLKRSYAEDVFDFQGAANQLLGRLTPSARQHPEETLRRAELLLSSYGVFAGIPLKDQASNRFISEELEGLATFTTVLPGIFLAVAAGVLNILMTRWTEQQRTIVGTLKALGYSSGEVFWHYVKFGLTVGMMGGLAGAVTGYYLAGWATDLYGQFYEFPDLHNRFYVGKTLIGLGISLGCATAGALYGAQKVLKLQPAEAMRSKPPPRGGAILLEKIGVLWRRFSFGWRLVLRSTFRNRLRTAAGVFASAMGTCILMTGFMMQEAMIFLVDFQFQQVQRSDLDLKFKDEKGIQALDETRRLPGVDYAEPLLDVSCTFYNGPYQKRGGIQGLKPGSLLTVPRAEDGNRIRIPEAGLAMSRALSDRLRLQVGDEVTIRPTKGLREDRQAPIMAVVDGYIGMSVYADIRYLNRLMEEEFTLSGVQLKTDGIPEHRLALHRQLKQMPALQSVTARADMIDNLNETIIKTQSAFIGLLVLFAGVIFFGSVLNASLINLAERRREVATFRVLGYGPWEVGGLFLRESMIVNLAGTLVGIPLGYHLSWLMVQSYNTEMFRIPVIITPGVVAWTLVLSIVFGILAHMFVQRVILKMDWLEALKVKE